MIVDVTNSREGIKRKDHSIETDYRKVTAITSCEVLGYVYVVLHLNNIEH